MMRETKGITIVALVITIVVILLLSGVVLNLMLNNSAMENARLAEKEYEKARATEELKIKILEAQTSLMKNGGSQPTIKEIAEYLQEKYEDIEMIIEYKEIASVIITDNGILEPKSAIIKFIGWEFKVKEDLKIDETYTKKIEITEDDEDVATVHLKFDKIIYIDANNGNDTTGNGSEELPYKTLDKIATSGIIETGYTYGIVLDDGEYELTESIFTLNCNKSIHVIGNKQNTTLKVISLYENARGGSTAYSVNFYRLVWNGTYAGTNTIWVKNEMNLYNVAFKLDFSESTHSYFIPDTGNTYSLYNCVLSTNVNKLLRATLGSIQLTNCYGGFTSGYGTTDDTWNYQTNYITSTPSVNTATYRITDDESVWKNVGTGTNFSDGQTSNLGVYGGDYDWNADVEIEAKAE